MFPGNRGLKVLTPRFALASDRDKILNLYKQVSKNAGGIARTHEEVTTQYVDDFMNKSAEQGIQLVIEDPLDDNMLLAEIHCYQLQPKVFAHVLSELTIVVNASYQRCGMGELIFTNLLHIVETQMPDILRVELIARESNTGALQLYKKIGFTIEGRFEKRIRSENGDLEADIPMAWFNKNYNHKENKKLP